MADSFAVLAGRSGCDPQPSTPRQLKSHTLKALADSPIDIRDADGFAHQYSLYRDRVYWYLLRRTSSSGDAADLTQQVFLKAFRTRAGFRSERGSFEAWIFIIARSMASSFVSRSRPTISWNALPQAALESAYPEASDVPIDKLDRLRSCLQRLDAKSQELIVLRFESGLRVSEIAAVVGKSQEATKKSLQRALKRIKEMYDDESI